MQPAEFHRTEELLLAAIAQACAQWSGRCEVLLRLESHGREELADCPAPNTGSKCVPDDFIRTGGDYVPPTCSSVAGAEGRCLSKALPEVKSQATLLPRATCDADELCVPCFNPLDRSDTGACHLSCDPGPTNGPTGLPACCDGRGTCVP